MYSNDVTQIKQGFTNYIGALIMAMKMSPRANRQQVVHILVEEIFNVSENEEGLIDLYVIKPFISGIIKFLKQRIDELEKSDVKTKAMKNTVSDYQQIIEFFAEFLKSIDTNALELDEIIRLALKKLMR